MKVTAAEIDSVHDGLKISVVVVWPEGTPKAVLQIAHGMCGSKERYMPFMEFMAMNGIACIANDHRGHGDSVKSERDWGYMYDGGADALVDDMRLVSEYAGKLFPGVPFCLLGHSMGALASRAYVRLDDSGMRGLVLCDCPSWNPFAYPVGKFLEFLCRCGFGHVRPKAFQAAVSSWNNRAFRSEGPQAWICSNPEARKGFMENPRNNFKFTVNGSACLMNLMHKAHCSGQWAMKSPDMPVLFLFGGDDPFMRGASGLRKSVDVMKRAGYGSMEVKTYPGMRHEILNEMGKEEVWRDILGFLTQSGL